MKAPLPFLLFDKRSPFAEGGIPTRRQLVNSSQSLLIRKTREIESEKLVVSAKIADTEHREANY